MHDASTCWTLIADAAAGDGAARREFARLYAPIVRTYLGRRWRGRPLAEELDDAVQNVFVECLRSGGVLERVDPDRPGGFRAFLYGAVRHVALRHEAASARRPRAAEPVRPPAGAEEMPTAPDRAFDRAWARSIVREALRRQVVRAEKEGEDAVRRVELLRLRFTEGLTVRAIAERRGVEPVHVHRDYARARREYRRELDRVLARYFPGDERVLQREGRRLIDLLR